MSAPQVTPPAGGGGGGGISGSGTAGYVAKFTGASAVGDSLIRDNGTDVSIDSSPSVGYKLTVNGDTTIVGRIDALTGSINTVTSRASTDLVFQRDTVEAARIIAGGKIGVGNTDPATLLETYGTTGIRVSSDSIANIGVFQYSSDATPATLALRKARGTRAAQTTIATSDQLGSVNFAAYGGTSGSTLSSISSYCEAYVGNADMSASLRFGVSPAGSATATETMRIMPGTAAIPIGNVGIGTTTPGTKLDVAYGDYQTIGAMRIGADIGTLSTRTNATAKFGAITVPHYTASEENIFLQGIHSLSSSTICYIGGGLNGFNASTSTRFYAAANNTTQAGTYIAQLTTSGIALDTGTSTLIFDAQTTGQGIKLPSTPGNGNARTLDCYEEGSYTATAAAFTVTGASPTQPLVVVQYTRIGRIVTLTGKVTLNAGTTNWASTIGGANITLPTGTTFDQIDGQLGAGLLWSTAGTPVVYSGVFMHPTQRLIYFPTVTPATTLTHYFTLQYMTAT